MNVSDGIEFLSAQDPGEAFSDLLIPIFASFLGNPKASFSPLLWHLLRSIELSISALSYEV